MELLGRLKADIRTPEKFASRLEASINRQEPKDFLATAFGLNTKQVLASIVSAPPNAAKGRWEGSDVDPSIRYRIGVVGANGWDWGNASLEIMHRMDPPDLSLGFALLCAKSRDSGPWTRMRAFVSQRSEQLNEIVAMLKDGGIDEIRIIQPVEAGSYRVRRRRGPQSTLRVRDADAGDVRYEVSRPKQRVHDVITNWLREWGDQQGLEILEGSDSISMYDALVKRDEGVDMLIEVKTSAEPGVVRLAVGQLIDYRRVLTREGFITSGILLLPPTEKLTDELKDLLKTVDFSWATILHVRSGGRTKLVLEIHSPNGTAHTIP
jgi:hypothetical protein